MTVANFGSQKEDQVAVTMYDLQGNLLATEILPELRAAEQLFVSLPWRLPLYTPGPGELSPLYFLRCVAGDPSLEEPPNDENNVLIVRVGCAPSGKTVEPLHKWPPHRWIVQQAYEYYKSQFEGSELGNYIDRSGEYNDVKDGSTDEDENDRPPLYQSLSWPFKPWMYHFCAGADGDEIYDGITKTMIFHSAYEQAELLWPHAVNNYPVNKELAYYCLGHLAHLIADMSVPAHVHNDGHPNDLPGAFEIFNDPDSYEETIGYAQNYELWKYGGGRGGPEGWIELYSTLFGLFYDTVNYTEDYDSDDRDGDLPPAYPNVDPHLPNSVDRSDGIDIGEITIIGDDLMPRAMKRTAELFRLFYRVVDTSSPVVSMTYPTSEDVENPTVRTSMSPFNLTASASDPESGILKQGYQYHWSYWTGSSWTSWDDAPGSPTGKSLSFTPPYDQTYYRFWVTAENGGGALRVATVKYLYVNTIAVYAITASAGLGGEISPSGSVSVQHGNNQRFDIFPDPGHYIEDVVVDGVSVGSVTSYEFSNVTSDHTIHASFARLVTMIFRAVTTNSGPREDMGPPNCPTVTYIKADGTSAYAYPYDGHDLTVQVRPASAWSYSQSSSGSTDAHRWYCNEELTGMAPPSGNQTVTKDYYEQYQKYFEAWTAEPGFDMRWPNNYVRIVVYQFGSAGTCTAYDNYRTGGWVDAGSDYTYAQESTASSASERWRSLTQKIGTITDADIVSWTFHHQYKPTITLNGTDDAHSVSTEQRTLFDSDSLQSALYGSWSDWCDKGSQLTLSQLTTGSPPRKTTDIRGWTVDSAFSEQVTYAPLSPSTWYADGSVPASGDGRSWETAFKTIQEGINAAWHGDEVVVAPGKYVEHVNFYGKAITLCSTNPTNPSIVGSTVIDGQGDRWGDWETWGSVVTFNSSEGLGSVITGFTITGGFASDGAGGGGILCEGSSPTITKNRVTLNRVMWGGGAGIKCANSSAVIW